MPPFTVPGTGIEPVQPQWPQDFKSCVSTSSTTRAAAAKVKKQLFNWRYGQIICRMRMNTLTNFFCIFC